MNHWFPTLNRHAGVGKRLIGLVRNGREPGFQMCHEARTIHRKIHHLSIGINAGRIGFPTDALRPGIGIPITPLDIQIPGFHIPENLGKHTCFKMLAIHSFRDHLPPRLPHDDASPGIRHPGKIHQRKHLWRRAFVALDARGVHIFAGTMLIGLQKLDRLLHALF